MAWYNYPVTQPFGLPYEPEYGGHSGVDLGTPNNTPLFLPVDGKVIEADYKPWGGQIAVLTSKGMMVFLHANEIYAKAGQSYTAGQVLGTSGGGVGDKILGSNGKVVVASSQSDFSGYSTGYHTHFAVFNVSTLAGISQSLGNNVNRLNPMPIVQAFISGKQVPTTQPLTSTVTGGNTTSSDSNIAGVDLHGAGAKVGIFVVGVVMGLIGIYALFPSEINGAAKKAAKVMLL